MFVGSAAVESIVCETELETLKCLFVVVVVELEGWGDAGGGEVSSSSVPASASGPGVTDAVRRGWLRRSAPCELHLHQATSIFQIA